MQSRVTKAAGNRYCQARLKAAKYNEKLLTRSGAADYLPGVTEDSLKKYELDITKAPNTVVALMELCRRAGNIDKFMDAHDEKESRRCADNAARSFGFELI